MDNSLQSNLTSITTQDEAVPFEQSLSQVHAQIPATRNCADDAEVINYVNSTLWPVLDWTRSNRSALEEEWREIRRMELMVHDSGRKYKGRSNAYLPVYLRALNTQVSQLSRGLFPSDEYMDVCARQNSKTDSLSAKAVKAYLQWEFDRVAKLRSNIKPFLRQFAAYGNSVLKYDYKKCSSYEGRRLPSSPDTGAPEYGFLPQMNEGLQVSTRSIFNTYIYPMTADNMEEVQVLFEDVDVPRSFIEERGRAKRWLHLDEALNAPEVPYHLTNRQELLSSAAGATSTVGPMIGTPLDVRTLTEVWVYMKLPPDQYLPHEDNQSNLLAKVTMAGMTAVEVIRCPFFHQRIPYLWARQNTSPGLFYGNLIGRAIKPAQLLANDFVNQTNDCGAYTLNPVVKVNPGMMAGPMPPLAPGRVIPLTDLKGMEFDRPPGELIQYGMQLTNQWVSYGQDLSGTPPVLQGNSASSTATSTQILQRNASTPLQDIVEDIENDVMEPLMYGAWCNAQQFRDTDVFLNVAGENLRVTPKDLILDADFRWLAANQAANQQQRASQATQFIQALLPLIPVFQQQGKQVNVEPILKRAYVDGMGFRDWDQVIMPASPMPPPMAPLQGTSPPGAPQPPTPQQPLSALSQIPGATEAAGGNVDLTPGEGDDYGAVRDQANELAAMAGGANNAPGGHG